ncbi:MAG: ABC transporter ATP-binding protein [Candidatus Nitrosocaldaceae archaeon]
MMQSLLVDNLKTYYFTNSGVVRAVDGVTFELKKGESLGLAGESGSGKSTLALSIMRILPSFAKIVSGRILLDSIDILSISEKDFNKSFRWKKISMIFQGAMNALDPVYNIRDQLYEILKYHNYKDRFEDRAKEVLEEVELESSVLNRYPHELSGGMKQRVVIASSLLLKPNLLIADEPTTALDVLVQAEIINLLKRLKREGMSIMLITHDLAIISEIAEKICIMYAGEIAEFGRAKDIYTKPMHPYTQALIKAIPRLRGEKKLSYIKGSQPNLIEPLEGCRFRDKCPYVMDVCKKTPPLIKSNDGYVRCWLYK